MISEKAGMTAASVVQCSAVHLGVPAKLSSGRRGAVCYEMLFSCVVKCSLALTGTFE